MIKHPAPKNFGDSTFTLEHIVLVIIGCLCPVVNIFMTIGCVVFFFTEVAPKVILFKPKQ